MSNRTIIVGVILLAVLSCKSIACELFYVPFSMQTYQPVTGADIEKRAHRSIKLPVDEKTRALVKEIVATAGNQKFDKKNVRLKILCGKNVVLVDNKGNKNKATALSAVPNVARLQTLVEEAFKSSK
jgi:hypothetical protein